MFASELVLLPVHFCLVELPDPSVPGFHTTFAGLSCPPQSTHGATQCWAQRGDPEAGQWAAVPSPALTCSVAFRVTQLCLCACDVPADDAAVGTVVAYL